MGWRGLERGMDERRRKVMISFEVDGDVGMEHTSKTWHCWPHV